jgi:PAS domain S-box-containing protein
MKEYDVGIGRQSASKRSRRITRYQRLVEAVVDYAIFQLDQNGYISTWNRGAERIKGYAPNEIIGQHFSVFYTPEDRQSGVPQQALRTATESGRYEAEGWRVRKDGSRLWAMVVIDAIYNDNGKVVGFAKVTRDMTERHETELELKAAQEQLAGAQKLEAIGQLSGGIAHDFNNLMMIVMGNLENAQTELRQGARNPALTRSVTNAMRGAQRAAALTSRLLAFSRRQPLDPKPLNLNQFLAGSAEFLQRSLGERVRIEVDATPDLPQIEVDPNQFESSLVNLAINARDAMPEGGGTLRIKALNADANQLRKLRLPSQDFVCIQISDTGSGISPDNIKRAFEPFFTTKELGRGTGLGLSQVYGFVKQSGGYIHLESEVGHGTIVHLCFPRLHRKQPTTPLEDDDQLPICTLENETILLVEDDDDLRGFIADVLSQLRYRVLDTADAEAALRIISNTKARVDLLMTDVVMPGKNGWELARSARRIRPDLKVLYMTGYSREVFGETKVRDQVTDLLHKPISQAQLATNVRSILDR